VPLQATAARAKAKAKAEAAASAKAEAAAKAKAKAEAKAEAKAKAKAKAEAEAAAKAEASAKAEAEAKVGSYQVRVRVLFSMLTVLLQHLRTDVDCSSCYIESGGSRTNYMILNAAKPYMCLCRQVMPSSTLAAQWQRSGARFGGARFIVGVTTRGAFGFR